MQVAFGRRIGAILTVVVLLSVLLVPAAMASDTVIHVVRPGETLSAIAYRYGVSAGAIAAANGITNWNRIYVGQRLVIPGPPPAPGPIPGPTPGRVHIVRWGETLSRIAAMYGVNVWAVAQANGIYNLNWIYTGQRLVIPGGAPPPPPPPPPPSGGAWQASYFNSRDLSGPVSLSRTDANLDFNWGYASPGAGVNPTNFSARWTRTFYQTAGTYRLTVRVDDGMRLSIDGTLIFDSWTVQALTTYQRDVILGTGNHTFTVEYFQAEGVAEIHVQSVKLN